MAVTVDSVSSASSSVTSSLSWLHTCSGANRTLIVFTQDELNVSPPTYDGIKFGEFEGRILGGLQVKGWFLPNPSLGTHTLRVQADNGNPAAAENIVAGAISLNGARFSGDYPASYPPSDSTTGNSLQASMTFTALTVGDMLLGAVVWGSPSVAGTLAAGPTARWNLAVSHLAGAGATRPLTTTTGTLTWNFPSAVPWAMAMGFVRQAVNNDLQLFPLQAPGLASAAGVLAIGSGLSLGLTGQALIAGSGTLILPSVLALSGQGAVVSQGVVLAPAGQPVTGLGAGSNFGALSLAGTVVLAGLGAAAQGGALQSALALSGQTLALGQGPLAQNSVVFPAGVQAAISLGAVGPSSVVPLTGQGAQTGQGPVLYGTPLTGLSLAGTVGVLGGVRASPVTGLSTTAAKGVVAATVGANVVAPLVGLSAATSPGVPASGEVVGLGSAGLFARGSAGAPVFYNPVMPAGQQGLGSAGLPTAAMAPALSGAALALQPGVFGSPAPSAALAGAALLSTAGQLTMAGRVAALTGLGAATAGSTAAMSSGGALAGLAAVSGRGALAARPGASLQGAALYTAAGVLLAPLALNPFDTGLVAFSELAFNEYVSLLTANYGLVGQQLQAGSGRLTYGVIAGKVVLLGGLGLTALAGVAAAGGGAATLAGLGLALRLGALAVRNGANVTTPVTGLQLQGTPGAPGATLAQGLAGQSGTGATGLVQTRNIFQPITGQGAVLSGGSGSARIAVLPNGKYLVMLGGRLLAQGIDPGDYSGGVRTVYVMLQITVVQVAAECTTVGVLVDEREDNENEAVFVRADSVKVSP